MNESQNRDVNINFQFKRSGDRDTINTFKQVQRGIDDARKASAQLTSQLQEARQVNLNALEDEAEQLTRQMREAKEETRAVTDELKKANQQSLSGGGRRSSSGGARQQISNAIGDGVGDVLQELTGNIGPLRTAANRAGDSIGDLVLKLGPQGLGLAAVGLAAAAAIKLVSDRVPDVTAGIREVIALDEEYYRLRRTGTTESIKELIKQQELEVQIAQDQVDGLSGVVDGYDEIKRRSGALSPVFEGIIEVFGALNADVYKDIRDARLEYDEANLSLKEATAQLDRYKRLLGESTVAANDAAQAAGEMLKKFIGGIGEFFEETQRYIDTQKQLAEANKAVADAEAERLKTIQKRQQEDIRAAQVADLERRIQQAQEKEAAEARKQRIVDLRSEGADAEAQILTKNNERMQQINEQFMANGLKALQRYLLAEQRATEDYNTNRVRKLQDLYDTLTDLAAQRDVAAFVSTRRSGLRDIQRGDEDFGTAARRRREDYDNERREALAARQQQIDDLRAAGQQELAERRQQLQQRIDDEIAAGEIELKQSEVLQQQLTALRARFAAQDLADRRRTEDEAYRTQLANLRNRQAEITRIINTTFSPAVTAVGNIGTALVNMVNNVRSAAAAPVASLGQQSVQVGRNYITAYDGGTRSVPVTGLYHLRRGESVLTINETNRMNRGDYQFARRGQGVTVNINATFGEIVTPSQMDAQIGAVVDGIRLAVNGG